MTASVEPIVVACAADDFFAMPLAVTVGSALANLSEDRRLAIYILDGGIRALNKRRITESLDPTRVTIHWISPKSKHLEAVANRCENNYPTFLNTSTKPPGLVGGLAFCVIMWAWFVEPLGGAKRLA